MPLHPIGTGDHQNCVVKHMQHTFGFGRKIHMPRRVQQGQSQITMLHQCLMRENRDASRLFQRIRIQKGIAMVNAAQLANLTSAIQQRLG